ncbi:MAG: hypothetical protein ACFE9S_13880, partial [Candidatus Hermodarchaeota archaeon]
MKLPKEIKDKTELTRLAKNRKCSIQGCSEIAIRSLSENSWKNYIEKVGLKFNSNSFHKIYLCKPHYNQANKYRKSQEQIFQKKGFLDNSATS